MATLSRDLVKEYIATELGDGRVVVELDDKHYEVCMQDAIDAINRFLPGWRRSLAGLGGASGSLKKYLVPVGDLPGFIDVIDVEFIRPELTGGVGLAENPFVLEQHVLHDTGMGFGDYAHSMAAYEDSKRVYSTDPDWEGHWELDTSDPSDPQQVFYLYVDLPDGIQYAPYQVSYTYAFHYEVSDDKLLGLPAIPAPRHQWFRKFCLARAKQVVSRIRGKFRGIPGADDGSQFELDFDDMRNEGIEDERSLLEDLQRQVRQLPPLTG